MNILVSYTRDFSFDITEGPLILSTDEAADIFSTIIAMLRKIDEDIFVLPENSQKMTFQQEI